MVRPNTQMARILLVLSDHRWHSVSDIHRKAGKCVLHSRISDLRRSHRYVIDHEIRGRKGAPASHRHGYRLISPIPSEQLSALQLTSAAQHPVPALDRGSTPRDPEHRFRIYRMVYDELELVGVAANSFSLGSLIVSLGQRGAFRESCLGLLDTHGQDEESGTWLINPWDTEPLEAKIAASVEQSWHEYNDDSALHG